jgi:hypothetical protein
VKKTIPSLLLVLVTAQGCNRDQVQSTRIEKTPPAALPPGHPSLPSAPGTPMPPVGEVPPPPAPGSVQGLQWTLPKGWTAAPAGGMRYATLKPPASGTLEVSVVVLAGSAGGELANANRWRAQLGLPPVDEAGLAAWRMAVKSRAGTVAVFEFNSNGNRMVVGFLPAADGHTWFLKLLGDDAAVSRVRPEFMKLLGTLTLG